MDLRSAFSGLLRRTCLLLFLIAIVSSLVGWFTWSLVIDVESRVAPVTQTTSRLQRQLAEVEALAGRLMLVDAAEAGAVESALDESLKQADASVRHLVELAAGDGRARLTELDGNLDTLRQARTAAALAGTTADTAGNAVSQAVIRTVEQVDVLAKTINDLRTGLQAMLRQAESNYRRCNQVAVKLGNVAMSLRQVRWSVDQGLHRLVPLDEVTARIAKETTAIETIAQDATVSNSARLRDAAIATRTEVTVALGDGAGDRAGQVQPLMERTAALEGEIQQWISELLQEATRHNQRLQTIIRMISLANSQAVRTSTCTAAARTLEGVTHRMRLASTSADVSARQKEATAQAELVATTLKGIKEGMAVLQEHALPEDLELVAAAITGVTQALAPTTTAITGQHGLVGAQESLLAARTRGRQALTAAAGAIAAFAHDNQERLTQAERTENDALSQIVTATVSAPIAVGTLAGLAALMAWRFTRRARREVESREAEAETRRAHLGQLVDEIRPETARLDTAAGDLGRIAQELNRGAQDTRAQAAAVNGDVRQVTDNLRSIASAAEEMSSSTMAIAKNAQDAAGVAREAVTLARESDDTMGTLKHLVEGIRSISAGITKIAEQTHLLALNAQIEASRAGDAGRGFTVVAQEVKRLAKFSHEKVAEVEQKIADIGHGMTRASSSLVRMGQIVQQIEGLQVSVAAAVEEQSATTSEIARQMSEALSRTQAVGETTGRLTQGADATVAEAERTRGAATALSGMAGHLAALVGNGDDKKAAPAAPAAG